MMFRARMICCWLALATAAAAPAQDLPPPEELARPNPVMEHSPHPEITAEDVPDHEPECERRWWVRGEYVLWLMKNAQTPPLLTTGLPTQPQPGVLLGPNARLIYGGDIDLHERHGGRFTVGRAFDSEGILSMEAIYGFAGNQRNTFSAASPGTSLAFPILARPFFDAVNLREDSSLVAFPALVGGVVDVDYSARFDSGELNLIRNVGGCESWWLDVIAGLRVCRLEEELNIQENVVVHPAAATALAGRTIRVQDIFETDNTFYGGQLGVRGVFRKKRWQVEAGVKIGLGVVDRELTIAGQTNIDPATVLPGGLLALSSNIGTYGGSDFCILPEASVQLGYRLTDSLQVYVGYSFLYWDRVFRPGDQVDRALNPNLIPTSATFGAAGGPPRPAALEQTSDFWMHGFRFGVEFKF